MMHARIIPSPVGLLLAATDEAGALVCLAFCRDRPAAELLADRRLGLDRGTVLDDHPDSAVVAQQIEQYFRGTRRAFELPLAPRGTPFQERVWAELRRIPYGVTITYRELAQRVGNAAAVRAVGRANAANPIPIIIPCHRVIGADGTLTGYGGGLHIKEALLRLEGVRCPANPVLELWSDGRR